MTEQEEIKEEWKDRIGDTEIILFSETIDLDQLNKKLEELL